MPARLIERRHPMAASRPVRTLEDLDRAVRAIATEFKTEQVIVIGSQSILLAWPDAPTIMRSSPEIDAYPENAKIWQIEEAKKHPGETPEASEHIDALFGMGSQFHRTHGFYIDGVDESTAKFPEGWQQRALVRSVEVGQRLVKVIAPSPEDLIVSKLARLDDKDKAFVEAYHSQRPLDLSLIEQGIERAGLEPALAERAIVYVRGLTKQ